MCEVIPPEFVPIATSGETVGIITEQFIRLQYIKNAK